MGGIKLSDVPKNCPKCGARTTVTSWGIGKGYASVKCIACEAPLSERGQMTDKS